MKNKTLALAWVSALFVTGSAWAADDIAGTDNVNPHSTSSADDVTRGYLKSEKVAITPQVGVMAFTDQFNNSTPRAVIGLTAESNFASSISRDSFSNAFVGPSVGVLYSHLGDPSSNLFGGNSNAPVGASGANLVLIPLNLKIGYNFTDSVRIAAHGGGNVVYRSVASSVNLGSSSVGLGSDWSIFPNVGGDIDMNLGRNIGLSLRPDVTITPGNTLFTGTVGLNFPMG